MKPISDLIRSNDLFGNSRFLSMGHHTERGSLMQSFVQRLNESRVEAGFEPLTMARMGRMLEGIETGDLYILEKKPERYPGTWSQYFHNAIKVK